MYKKILLIALVFTGSMGLFAQKKGKEAEKPAKDIPDAMFNSFALRSVGPAMKAGRIADIEVNPYNHDEYYLGVAAGGVWKTVNAGTTYEPIFDSQASFSIGCVKIDPSNTNIVWVGSGENNNQRSVSYGDGVYKSIDAGKTWKNMGLKNSQHIGNMIIHPTNSDVVYVAAYGPVWNEGGDRGIYKTTDGGESWEKVLFVSENTGFADIVMDPRNPEVLYASAHQRRRHVFTHIGGGPESGLYKTVDGGKNWIKVNTGLTKEDKGRIGLAISPANPDYIYAIVEAANGEGGFYRSTDGAASWNKMSSYSTSGNYYQEIVCDPIDPDKVFALDTWLHHTEDGGKTFISNPENNKHVDNHDIWVDPGNTAHWRVTCDGGLYETWDMSTTWQYKANLPITQFYKVAIDYAEPFYNIYGGTQDNNSQGGPSRTVNNAGIMNSDWYITNGGDGFESQIDYTDPNIVYAQAQYGWIVRYDHKSGEKVSIKPYPKKGGDALRWNWDAPLLISPNDHNTLYFCAQKVFKSTDRGDSWTEISGDLSRGLDRNTMKVMGKVWSIDAVAKNGSTTIFGNIVAFDESPKKAGLLYVGSDDGLIQVTENDGANWTKYASFTGIPDMTYVNMLIASQHDENVVYAVFNNHKRGDFKPYIKRSADKGKTWTDVQGDLPKEGAAYAIAEDHVNPNILFAGTEYGVFVTLNRGKNWHQLKTGLPTTCVRDLAIQKRENDLVLATFGRSFYVLDDYSALREMAKADFNKTNSTIFPVKPALQYIPTNPIGLTGKADQGASFYTAPNPEFGATFRYNYADTVKTAKAIRQEKEKKEKDNYYPSFEQLKIEEMQDEAFLLFVVKGMDGTVLSKIKKPATGGTGTAVWDLRVMVSNPTRLTPPVIGRYSDGGLGPLAMPGFYTVEMILANDGEFTQVTEPVKFEVKLLDNRTIQATDLEALLAFQNDINVLNRSISGSQKLMQETNERLKYIKRAIEEYPNADFTWMKKVEELELSMFDINIAFNGDGVRAKHEFETYPGLSERLDIASYSTMESFSPPTNTAMMNYNIALEEYNAEIVNLQKVVSDLAVLEAAMDEAKMPYTPGRNENWKDN